MVRATPQIIAICLVVYVAQLGVALAVGAEQMAELFALALPLDAQPWTVVTSVYAHSGPWHLLSNLALFALLGLAVERKASATGVHLYVLATGAIANVSQVVFSNVVVSVDAHVLGLSGAIFALIGYVVTGNRLSGFMLDRFEVPHGVQLVVYLALAVAVTLATAEPGVAIVGHFTGLFLGLVLGAGTVLSADRLAVEEPPEHR
ncbi:rhomboid family protein [Salinarchaeum sp. Harcht-Bsk1]|uniref:rhomboid family intramembrane serine protease n=1 Tax=Salinarchaeum sp. Harcht-Bsk1 TaxID=1333523 RepID=UPI0003423004|nr:rhomboid family intramembrane serine protease [Salinarchaeum sp. Harcht-Bsk1]AGN01898.1 rhomboid family protein [Salinarchaeum sp. Harcht-Bsk1]